MRLSPDGLHYAYVAGLGLRPVSPMVTVVEATGRSVALEPGHDVGWSDDRRIFWSPQDESGVRQARGDAWDVDPTGIVSGNTIAVAGGVVAAYRTDPRRVLVYLPGQWHAPRVIPGAMAPALSDDGLWIAGVLADTSIDENGRPQSTPGVSTLFVERASDGGDRRWLHQGAPGLPRFGGTTVAWETGDGHVAACADVANPQVQTTYFLLPSAWRCFKPKPVWVPTRGELLLLFIADDGEYGHIKLASWASLEAGAPKGYDVGVSSGAGYDHDARPIGDRVIVRWLNPAGLPAGTICSLTSPRALLSPPQSSKPDPLPDVAFAVTAGATPVDVWPVIVATTLAENVRSDDLAVFLHKSQERPNWGEVWDADGVHVGHLYDQSTGLYNYTAPDGTVIRLSAHQLHALGVDWCTLPLAGYGFAHGRRVFMPRQWSGTLFSLSYETTLTWNNGDVEEVPITITAVRGRGRYRGVEVTGRHTYDPRKRDKANPKRKTGYLEINYVTTDAPGRFWVRHEVHQDDADGVLRLIRVDQSEPEAV